MLEKEPEVLVKFTNGDVTSFSISGHEEFEKLVDQFSSLWRVWVYIGHDCAVRKRTVNQLYYFPEGYAKSCERCA